MKRFTTILTFLMLVCMGASADVTVTLVDGTNATANAPFTKYGTRNNSANPNTFTTKDASGLAGIVLTAPVIDQAQSWFNTYCMALKPSVGQTDETLTITAPAGFVITGYNFNFRANADACTYKVAVQGGAKTDVGKSSTVNFSGSSLYIQKLNIVINAQSSTLNWLAVLGMTVTLRPVIARAGNRVELNSISAGTKYMFFDTHNSGTTSNNEPRCGFVGANNGNITKDLNTAPKSHTDINGHQLWQLEDAESSGQYYAFNFYANQYYNAPSSLSATTTQKIQFSQYAGSSQSLNDDGTFNTTPSGDNHIVQIENVGQDGNNKYWNGNRGSFATWSDAHPYVIYEAVIPDVACNLSDISTTKKYNIANPRGWWAVSSGATDVNSTAELSLAIAWSDAKQQFAFIQYNGNYYLYSVSEGKFAYVNGTKLSLSAEVTGAVLASPVTYTASAYTATKGTYPFVLTIGGLHFGVSTGHSPDVYQHTSTNDEGNGALLIEAGDFDPSVVTPLFNNVVSLTYKVVDNNAVLDGVEAEKESVVGETLAIPSSLNRELCSFTFYSDEACTSEVTTVSKDVTTIYAKCTFSLSSSDVDHLSWYRLAGKSSNGFYYDLYNNGSAPYPYREQSAFDGSDGYFWAFVGNPYDGFKVYNKAEGTSKTMIYNNDTNPIMGTDDGTKWYICFYEGNIGFIYKGNSGKRWNDYGGGTSTLKYHSNATYHQYTNIDAVDYSSLVTKNIQPFIDNAGDDYFKITSTYAAALSGAITKANSDATITLTEYQELVGSLAQLIKWPTTGYYRLKSVTAETYLKATNAAQLNVGGTNSEVATIVYLDGSRGTYTMQMQGKYIAIQSNSVPTRLNDESLTNYFTIPTSSGTVQPGQVIIGGGVTSTDYMRVNGDNVIGVATATSPNGNNACYWTVENAATTVTIPLTTIGNYAYATTCLPFDVTITSGANAYVMAESGEWLVPTQLTDNKVPAGTPVLLRGTSGTASATATINTGAAFATVEGNVLSGTYLAKDFALSGTPAATAEYFLGKKNGVLGFYHSAVESKEGFYTLGANKAYLSSSAGARGFAIMWDENETTGVNEVIGKMSEVTDGAIYDLQGRKVANPSRGMYIINGRKVVVK